MTRAYCASPPSAWSGSGRWRRGAAAAACAKAWGGVQVVAQSVWAPAGGGGPVRQEKICRQPKRLVQKRTSAFSPGIEPRRLQDPRTLAADGGAPMSLRCPTRCPLGLMCPGGMGLGRGLHTYPSGCLRVRRGLLQARAPVPRAT